MDYNKENLIYITGQAQLSENDAISSVYSIFSLALIIDIETDIIKDVECTSAMKLTSKFISDIIIGKNIETDIEYIIGDVKKRFHGLSKKALIASLMDVSNRYNNQIKGI